MRKYKFTFILQTHFFCYFAQFDLDRTNELDCKIVSESRNIETRTRYCCCGSGYVSDLNRSQIGKELIIIILYWFRFFFFAVPPNIIDTESTQSTVAVRENQNISLTCKADGFPTPKIMWRREDGQQISVDRRQKGLRYTIPIRLLINLHVIP